MLVENGGGDAGAAGVFHPDDPGAVVLERCAEDVAFATVLGESLAPVGFVVHKGFHADGNEGSSVVVMSSVDVGVGGDLGEHVGLPQEKELAFGLRDGLAPKVAWECCGGAAQDADEVIFPSLDGLFCDVAAVIIGGNKLKCHVSERNLLLVCC